MQKLIETTLGIFDLRTELIELGCKKFFLVADPSLDNERVINSLEAFDIPYVRFSSFAMNPTRQQASAAVEAFRREDCDSVVSIGGGSTLDVAKWVKSETCVPLIAVPTTIGTGCEATPFVVLTVDGIKLHLRNENMLPDVVIFDPTLVDTLPIYQRKCGSLDTFAHAVESMWSHKATDETIAYAKEALQIILTNYRDYVFDYTHQAARQMFRASHLAGQAIAHTHTTAVHALSFPLTTQLGLPHGHAVGLCLPQVMEFVMRNASQCNDPRGEGHLIQMLKEIASIMHGVSISDAIVRLRIVLAELQLAVPLGVTMDDVERLTDAIDLERIGNSPVPFTREDVKELYRKILRIRL